MATTPVGSSAVAPLLKMQVAVGHTTKPRAYALITAQWKFHHFKDFSKKGSLSRTEGSRVDPQLNQGSGGLPRLKKNGAEEAESQPATGGGLSPDGTVRPNRGGGGVAHKVIMVEE